VRYGGTDQKGLFRFKNVAPGDYYAVALDSVEPLDLASPDYLATLARTATRATVREGQPVSLTLTLPRK